MNQQSYQSLTNWFYQRPILNKILVSCCRLFPYSMFFLYAVGSVCLFSHFLFYGFDAEYLLFWIIPAAGFVLVSVLRKKINAPRPYDLFDFTPLIGHESGASLRLFNFFCFALDFFAQSFPNSFGYFVWSFSIADRCLPHSCRTSFSERCVLRCAVFPCFLRCMLPIVFCPSWLFCSLSLTFFGQFPG